MKTYCVDIYIDEMLVDTNVFITRRQAVNYVSGEYIYYSKKYVDTEKFNCATTVTKPIKEIDYDDDNDYYCEPFDINLVEAYIDEWDNVLDWIIREVGA